jgi:hypothetical protein
VASDDLAAPLPLRPTEDEDAELAQANATRHDWIAAGGRRDRTRLSPRFHRTADYLVNTTDPDATYLHLRDVMGCGSATRPALAST